MSRVTKYLKRSILAVCIIYSIIGAAKFAFSVKAEQFEDTTLHVKNMDVPFSVYASDEARNAFMELLGKNPLQFAITNIDEVRAYFEDENKGYLDEALVRYPSTITSKLLSGVQVEEIVPRGGVTKENANRVLINLHGGGFLWGAGSGARIESVPISSVMGIKVVTVDYRMAPEHKFPAASDDVIAVYKALLQDYQPNQIGLYGCSAGGMLVSQVIAKLIEDGLPVPGAAGMFCGAGGDMFGDSRFTGSALSGKGVLELGAFNPTVYFVPYFSDADKASPQLSPQNYPELLAQYPPVLFISSTRDFALSSMLHHNNKLAAVGVDTQFYAWDGLWHGFFLDTDIPESREVYQIVAGFFDQRLAP